MSQLTREQKIEKILEDYSKNPKEYCSMSIKDNPYFDLV